MPAKKLPGRFISSSRRLCTVAGILCLSALLSGCPSASNPTKGPPSTPGSAGLPGAIPGPMPGPMPGGAPGPMPGGVPGGSPTGQPGGDMNGAPDGSMEGSTEGTASTGDPTGSSSSGDPATNGGAQGGTGSPSGSGNVDGSGGGPLTPAEQVAVLDAELERGTGDFDTMILDTQEDQREERRGSPGVPPPSQSGGDVPAGSGSDGDIAAHIPEVYDVPDAPGGRGAPAPQNVAKYPPPADIPSGNDDDVVARQLRELAMSEPDPAVRERLWEEYRKYKGIE